MLYDKERYKMFNKLKEKTMKKKILLVAIAILGLSFSNTVHADWYDEFLPADGSMPAFISPLAIEDSESTCPDLKAVQCTDGFDKDYFVNKCVEGTLKENSFKETEKEIKESCRSHILRAEVMRHKCSCE